MNMNTPQVANVTFQQVGVHSHSSHPISQHFGHSQFGISHFNGVHSPQQLSQLPQSPQSPHSGILHSGILHSGILHSGMQSLQAAQVRAAQQAVQAAHLQ